MPSSVRVCRDSLGHWYCSFVVQTQVQPLPATGRVIGVDSESRPAGGEDPEEGRPAAADAARKWAKRVVRDHDALAVEDFRPKFLAKSTMARKAADAAIGATKRGLIAMARKHGRDLRLVDPKHTTMDCASCGARTKHALPLSERTYTCTSCGAVSPRDKNSAAVMLVRAGLNPEGIRPARPPDEQAARAENPRQPVQGGNPVVPRGATESLPFRVGSIQRLTLVG
ncbi:hypothetical protein GCM10027200_66220 [Lentzea nigeriaca]